MQERCPDIKGFVERNGVKVGYEVFGEGEPTISLHVLGDRAGPAVEGSGAVPGAAIPRYRCRGSRQRPGRPADDGRGL